MPQGGKRPNAGRKPKPKTPDVADKGMAARILAFKERSHEPACQCEDCEWWDILHAHDVRLRLDARKYLSDKRDGKAVQTVNHVHDKPIDVNVHFDLTDRIAAGRRRAALNIK
jgi:hypothetical protein